MNANVSGISNSMKGIIEPRPTQPKINPDSSGMPKIGGSDSKKVDPSQFN